MKRAAAALAFLLAACATVQKPPETPQACVIPDGYGVISDDSVERVNAEYTRLVRELNEANRKLRNGCT